MRASATSIMLGGECTSGSARVQAVPRQLHSARSHFKGKELKRANRSSVVARKQVVTENFKFMKNLGLKKPAFLPDFGLDKRKALLDNFFTSFDKSTLQSLLADNAQVSGGGKEQSLGKKGYIDFVSETLKPAIPNFSWSHATTGEKDDQGYSIVRVQAAGTHSGSAYKLPGSSLPAVDVSNKRLSLPEQTIKVKVEDGVIQELKFLSQGEQLQLDIYRALGGKVPASV